MIGTKVAILCLLLPSAVGVASSMLATNQIAPSMNSVVLERSAKSALVSQQVVNRSLKGDQLPVRKVKPEESKRPFRRVPSQKTDFNCKPPIDLPGRCFA